MRTTVGLVRQEKYAVVNKDNDVRVVLNRVTMAERMAARLTDSKNGFGPYRVVKVVIQEVVQ